MKRPLLLDLFCGAGGAAMGYHRAGFDVIGVDVVPMPDYPFEFHLADATTFELAGFDAIHASPPCKAFTVARHRHKVPHPDLLTPTLMRFAGLSVPWVVENVPGAPLPSTSVLYCGSSFGLQVRRHRLFASNVALMAPPCAHHLQPVVLGVYGTGGAWKRKAPGGGGQKVAGPDAARALGIEHTHRQAGLSQAIPPAYTEHIGHQLLAHIGRAAA